MLNIPKRLKYETINNSNDAISVDLHNGYKVIAITGKQSENTYTTTLFLKEKTIDNLILIDNAEKIEFTLKPSTSINSAILRKIGDLLADNFFDYYIKRYEYELKCFEEGSKYIKFEAENA